MWKKLASARASVECRPGCPKTLGQLWDTTLNPDTRRLLPVQLGCFNFAQTESLITKLMGKGEAAARRELMELHGDAVDVDV